jgi:selenocysteine-specific elongation factor
MRVIGTSGHVDHGKSTLVAALTGIQPDRLKEEQAREMTIDLGFAWMDLPDGETVGIVDVPGHRDFIENMLAGVGGIDAVLFVVAADEGVMPQTREHLDILDLLQIPLGVIALTKIDLVDDEEWLNLVEADVRALTRGTVLEKSPIVRVSARSGAGLAELKAVLANSLKERPQRADLGRPRLPIDRVFTMTGFGAVVTGTLLDGELKTGDEVEILPSGIKARIRGLQTHRKSEKSAVPGSRTAVNLNGVSSEAIQRGNVLALPGTYSTSQRIDVFFRLLKSASLPLKHNQEVKFFLGASETTGRVRLLGCEQIEPGQEGWLQIELKTAVVAVRGDHFILRRPSPGETLGGGIVMDASPQERHRRFDPQVMSRLEALKEGAPADVLLQTLTRLGIITISDLINASHLEVENAKSVLSELTISGQVIQIDANGLVKNKDPLMADKTTWQKISRAGLEALMEFHQRNPLRVGMPREELKSRLKMTQRVFAACLTAWLDAGLFVEENGLLHVHDWQMKFTDQQNEKAHNLLQKFKMTPYQPPSVKECQALVGEDLTQALVDNGSLARLNEDVLFDTETFQRLISETRALLAQKETLTVAEFRDHYQTSRKYALAFLEYLDQTGVTVREGDFRRLKKGQL